MKILACLFSLAIIAIAALVATPKWVDSSIDRSLLSEMIFAGSSSWLAMGEREGVDRDRRNGEYREDRATGRYRELERKDRPNEGATEREERFGRQEGAEREYERRPTGGTYDGDRREGEDTGRWADGLNDEARRESQMGTKGAGDERFYNGENGRFHPRGDDSDEGRSR